MDFGDELPLSATIPADHWASMKRRLVYLEAVIIQILGDRSLLKEWYTAGELADLRLPGLPHTRQGVARLANARGWRSHITMQRGREARLYHCTALPARAFDGLLDRIIVRGAMRRADAAPAAPARSTTPHAAPVPSIPENTAPPWVLPLLRIVRASGSLSVASAVEELPRHLPPGVACPSHQEAEDMLRKLGMVAG